MFCRVYSKKRRELRAGNENDIFSVNQPVFGVCMGYYLPEYRRVILHVAHDPFGPMPLPRPAPPQAPTHPNPRAPPVFSRASSADNAFLACTHLSYAFACTNFSRTGCFVRIYIARWLLQPPPLRSRETAWSSAGTVVWASRSCGTSKSGRATSWPRRGRPTRTLR